MAAGSFRWVYLLFLLYHILYKKISTAPVKCLAKKNLQEMFVERNSASGIYTI